MNAEIRFIADQDLDDVVGGMMHLPDDASKPPANTPNRGGDTLGGALFGGWFGLLTGIAVGVALA